MRQYLSFEPSCTFLRPFLWKLVIWPIFLLTRARNTCFRSKIALRTGCIWKGIVCNPWNYIQNLGLLSGCIFMKHRNFTHFFREIRVRNTWWGWKWFFFTWFVFYASIPFIWAILHFPVCICMKVSNWPIYSETRGQKHVLTTEIALRTSCIRKTIEFTPSNHLPNYGMEICPGGSGGC